MTTALLLWLAIEATNQTSRIGWIKVWRVDRVPVLGSSGLTLHPWLVLSTERSEAHERHHVKQMARYGWLPYVVLYLLSGAFRFRSEVECDVAAIPPSVLNAGLNDPVLTTKAAQIAISNRREPYFGKWYLPGTPPDPETAKDIVWRAVIKRRKAEGGV